MLFRSWKWLFVYPQYGVAAVNEMAAPVDRPITFHITSSSVMNSFFVPALAGQIYAMPGMETQLHAVINEPGEFEGFSANYSGAGFSGMRFAFHGVSGDGFDQWVAAAKAGGGNLDRARYLELERPSENVPAQTFGTVDPKLYKAALNMCVEPGKMCMDQMMAIDAKGGLGLAGVGNLKSLDYDKYVRRGAVAGLCSNDEAEQAAASPAAITPVSVASRPSDTAEMRMTPAPSPVSSSAVQPSK